MSDVAFFFDNVSKTFRSRAGESVSALKDFSFSGERGRISCLLGTTGCGKTTALRLAAGLERPEAGTVTVKTAEGFLGYITQQHGNLPWLRLVDNVAFPLMLRGVPGNVRRRKATELLTRVRMGDAGRLYPHECSGGMLQRAMLARLLALGADHWLLDEPFGALDERTRHHLQRLLLTLKDEQGLSALFVTHSIEEAVFIADRIGIMGVGPGCILEVIDLNEPHPRDRLSDTFALRMEQVRRALEKTIEEPQG